MSKSNSKTYKRYRPGHKRTTIEIPDDVMELIEKVREIDSKIVCWKHGISYYITVGMKKYCDEYIKNVGLSS